MLAMHSKVRARHERDEDEVNFPEQMGGREAGRRARRRMNYNDYRRFCSGLPPTFSAETSLFGHHRRPSDAARPLARRLCCERRRRMAEDEERTLKCRAACGELWMDSRGRGSSTLPMDSSPQSTSPSDASPSRALSSEACAGSHLSSNWVLPLSPMSSSLV